MVINLRLSDIDGPETDEEPKDAAKRGLASLKELWAEAKRNNWEIGCLVWAKANSSDSTKKHRLQVDIVVYGATTEKVTY
jgi:hypothetical protein